MAHRVKGPAALSAAFLTAIAMLAQSVHAIPAQATTGLPVTPKASAVPDPKSTAIPEPENDWRKVKCSDPDVTDGSEDGAWRWNEVAAPAAWNEVVREWEEYSAKPSPSPFPIFVSPFFGGPENMNCHKLAADNGCHGGTYFKCEDVEYPAGYLILNSIWKIESFLWNMHSALSEAHLAIIGDVGDVTTTFAPVKPVDSSALNIILDTVGIGFSAFAAPAWNLFLKRLPVAEKNPNGFDTIKDFTNDMVTNGISLAKDLTAGGEPGLATKNKVDSILKDIVVIWKDTIVKFAEELFNGKEESVKRLGRMMANGAMISGATEIPSVTELRKKLSRSIYAQLIPLSWRVSEKGIKPFIMDLGLKCSEAAEKDEKHTCFDGRAYALRSIDPKTVQEDCNTESSAMDIEKENCPLPSPPGLDTLNGKRWGGITEEDIIIGSLKTFKDKGNKNRKTASKEREIDDDEITDMAEDIRAPGVFTLPVCSEDDARTNFKKDENSKDFNFPCSIQYQDPRYKPAPDSRFTCKRSSAMCAGAANLVRNCDRAVNGKLIRNGDENYGGDGNEKGKPAGGRKGNCKVFIGGHKDCYRSGDQMWKDYQEIRDQGGCDKCGRKYWGPHWNCWTRIEYVL